MVNTYETHTLSTPRGSVVIGHGHKLTHESDGCGHVNWNVMVPDYWNDVRFFRDVRAHIGLTLTFSTICATCNGDGRVPYAQDVNKRFRRMRKCPDHVETVTRPASIYDVPPMPGQRCDYL